MRQPRRDPTDAERAAVRATVAALHHATENNTTAIQAKERKSHDIAEQMHAVRAHQPPPQPTPTAPAFVVAIREAAGITPIAPSQKPQHLGPIIQGEPLDEADELPEPAPPEPEPDDDGGDEDDLLPDEMAAEMEEAWA